MCLNWFTGVARGPHPSRAASSPAWFLLRSAALPPTPASFILPSSTLPPTSPIAIGCSFFDASQLTIIKPVQRVNVIGRHPFVRLELFCFTWNPFFFAHTRMCFLTVFVMIFFFAPFFFFFFHRVPRVLPQRLFPPGQRLPSMPAAGRAQREDGAQKHGGTRGRGRRALVPGDGRLKRRAQRDHDCSDSQRFIFQSSHAWVTIRQTNAAFYYIGCWSLFIHLAEAIPLWTHALYFFVSQ